MAKIKGSEIIENNLFDNAAKSGKELVGVLKEVEKELKDVAKAQNKIAQNSGTKDFKSLQKKTQAIKEVRTATEGLTKVQKSLKRAEEELLVSTTKEAKALAKVKAELNAVKKAQRDNIKATRESGNAYKTLSAQTNKAQAEFKRLAAQFGVNSKQARSAKIAFEKLDGKLRKVNDAARDGRRDVGRYGKAFGGLKRGIKSALVSLGLVAGFAALGRGIKNVVGVFSQFEQGSANLAAVLGKSRKEIKILTQDAKRLGSSTKFTAQEVTKLQVEFAKLGFNESEIISATEATLDLAAATGTDLAEAAAVAGATLGGFGLEADETQRAVDVMAKSFSTSALDMEKFKESMKTAAPAAAAVGISIEKTTALLGTMANAGISGSKAGNNLKTSLINLNKAGISLEQGLSQVKNSTDKLGTATELVGKNAAASFLVLADGTETTKELTKELINAGGAAQEMADTQMDTLTGATTRLSSAWEGFILSLEDGDGVIGQVLRKAIDLATDFLTVLSDIGKSGKKMNEERIAGVLAESEAFAVSEIIQKEIIGFQEKATEELQKLAKEGNLVAQETLRLRDKETEFLQSQIEVSQKVIQINNARNNSSEKAGKVRLGQISEEITRLRNIEGSVFSTTKLLTAQIEIKTLQNEKQKIFDEINQRTGKINALEDFRNSSLKKTSQEELISLTQLQGRTNADLVKLAEAELQRRKDIGKVSADGLDITHKEVDALTGLAKLQDELNKKEKQRSDYLVDNNGLNTEHFNTLTAETKELKIQIQYYKDILKEVNKIKEAEQLSFDNRTDDNRKELAKRKKFLAEQNESILGETDTFEDMPLATLSEEDTKALEEYKDNTQKLIDENTKRKESMRDLSQTVTDALTVLNNIVQKKAQERVEAIDREIQASQSAQDILRTIAQQGVADSEENLAFEQQKQAELEQRKQREIERAANLELVLSAVSTFNAQVQAGATPAEALGSTAVTMTALEALVSGLDLFYEGTENTGTAANPLDSNGGRLAVLHDNERVITSAQNDVIGNMTNWELANMAGDYKDGSKTMQNATLTQPFMGGQEMLNRLDSIESAIVNKPALTEIKFNEFEKSMVYTIESKNRKERNHVKIQA